MKHEYLSWRGQRIHLLDTHREGEPLLMLNGLGGNTRMWLPFSERFGARRILGFDAPGTGLSTTHIWSIPIATLAELAVTVLDNRGVAWADVIGYSYGGAVAQQLAHEYPGRIRRLVLASTTCGVGAIPGPPSALEVLATPVRYYSQTYFERIAPATFGGETARSESVRRRMFEMRHERPPSSQGYIAQLLGGAGWSSRHFLEGIEHETLVISGDDDPLIPVANAELLANAIPRARLEIVKGAGHLCLWDDPKNLAPRVERFVNAANTQARAPRRLRSSGRLQRKRNAGPA